MPTFFAMRASWRDELPPREVDGGPLVGEVRLGGRDLLAAAAGLQVLEARLGRAEGVAVPLDGEGGLAEVEQ